MTDTRSRRAIATTACPVCHAPRGERCVFTKEEKSGVIKMRAMMIHGARRALWQQVRDESRTDLHVATADDARFLVTPLPTGAISIRVTAADRDRLLEEIEWLVEDVEDRLHDYPPDEQSVAQDEHESLRMLRALADAMRGT